MSIYMKITLYVQFHEEHILYLLIYTKRTLCICLQYIREEIGQKHPVNSENDTSFFTFLVFHRRSFL